MRFITTFLKYFCMKCITNFSDSMFGDIQDLTDMAGLILQSIENLLIFGMMTGNIAENSFIESILNERSFTQRSFTESSFTDTVTLKGIPQFP